MEGQKNCRSLPRHGHRQKQPHHQGGRRGCKDTRQVRPSSATLDRRLRLCSNGQWPQVRLRSARLADSDRCQLCQVEKGTIANRRIYIASENIRCHAAVPKHVEAVVNELAEAQKK